MLLTTVPALAFGTNCYLLAPAEGEECVIVDPGIGVEDRITEALRRHRLRPAAVLLTHGHVDHVYAVTPVCGGTLAAHIHGDDRYRLRDPLAGHEDLVRALEQHFGSSARWSEPEHVVELVDGQQLDLAGLRLGVRHAPGHTEGSVLFTLDGVPTGVSGPAAEELDRTVLSGDVLFAGSIGRTDLPGGDPAAMQRSLREVVLPLADSTLVLPGHGGVTTMARERRTNPYLQGL